MPHFRGSYLESVLKRAVCASYTVQSSFCTCRPLCHSVCVIAGFHVLFIQLITSIIHLILATSNLLHLSHPDPRQHTPPIIFTIQSQLIKLLRQLSCVSKSLNATPSVGASTTNTTSMRAQTTAVVVTTYRQGRS